MNAQIVSEIDLDARTGPIDLLLNEHWLSELVGDQILARRIRHKPGVGAVASFGPATGPDRGWVQLAAQSAHDKIVNAERRAAERHRAVTVRPLARGWTAVHGVVASDPRLHRALDQIPTEVVDGLARGEGVQILRYNPHRRLVMRWHDTVLRLTTNRQSHVVAGAHTLAAAGITSSRPVRVQGVVPGKRVTAWPWVDGTDLLEAPSAEGAVAAGEMLARWHAQPVNEAPAALPRFSPKASLQSTVDELAELIPQLAREAKPVIAALLTRITQELNDQPRKWSHGDFSADQVILLPGGGVQVIDLDRSPMAPVGADLGSFCAVERLRHHQAAPVADLSDNLLLGYAAAGGVLPRPQSLRDWTAYGMLTRLTEPMRHAQPTWRDNMEQRWAEVKEILLS